MTSIELLRKLVDKVFFGDFWRPEGPRGAPGQVILFLGDKEREILKDLRSEETQKEKVFWK